jgi:phosphatidylinositol dimannoside acyltransferase
VIFPESPLRDLYRALVWGPYRRSVLRLPPTVEVALNRRLGETVARLLPSSRSRVEANLRRAFPGRDHLDEVAVSVLGTHFANQYLPFSFGRMDARNAPAYLRVEVLGPLDAALGGGGGGGGSGARGAVLLHPHMGPAQLPLAVLGLLGYPMHQIGGGEVATLTDTGRRYAAFRHSLEGAMRGVTLVDGKAFLRPVLRALASGAVVMTTCDGTGGGAELGRRVVRTVLGQRMKLPVGAIWLALKSGAPLLPLYTFHRPGRLPAHSSVIGPELVLPREAPFAEALEAGADRVADFLDRVLGEPPEDWHFWDQFEPGCFLVSEGSDGSP